MSTVSLGKRTRVVSSATVGVYVVIAPLAPMAVLLGGITDDVTADHRSAQLRAGATYSWPTTAGARRLSMLSLDPAAPDDPLPQGDSRAALIDVAESATPVLAAALNAGKQQGG